MTQKYSMWDMVRYCLSTLPDLNRAAAEAAVL